MACSTREACDFRSPFQSIKRMSAKKKELKGAHKDPVEALKQSLERSVLKDAQTHYRIRGQKALSLSILLLFYPSFLLTASGLILPM